MIKLNPDLEVYNGSLWLEDYDHPLPKSLTTIGPLFLGGYDHPLPDSLKTINGYLCLEVYKHPLPEGLTTINSDLFQSLLGLQNQELFHGKERTIPLPDSRWSPCPLPSFYEKEKKKT